MAGNKSPCDPSSRTSLTENGTRPTFSLYSASKDRGETTTTASKLRRRSGTLRRISPSYGLITINHAATIGPCGPRPRPAPAAGGGASAGGAGAGPRSGWNRYTLCVTGSTVIVFAPAKVATVATVVYLSGESWCTTVTLPSPPLGMKINFFARSRPKASTRVPLGMDATTFPVLASTTTEFLGQPAKIRFDALSYAMPVGPSHGA